MKYLTVNDVCSLWGVSQQFVRRLCKEGRIPGAEQTDDGWLIPEGTEIPIEQRTPGCFYLEQTKQTSIRTKINVPTSVVVSSSLGLKRV